MKLYLAIFLFAATFLSIECRPNKNPRIVNGRVAVEGQFPWEVGIVNYKSSLLYYCAGAIISDRWILTSAHCILDAESLVVIYGSLDLEAINITFSLSNDYIIHENFDSVTFQNNIGVVGLNESLQFNDKVQAIALADSELKAGTKVTVSGWGTTSDDDSSHVYDTLRYITSTTIDNEDCLEVYGLDVVYNGLVCTSPGDPVRNPCLGDGGAPAVTYTNPNKPVHVAFFSFLSTFGCESTTFPAGYIRTAYYRSWIRKVTGV